MIFRIILNCISYNQLRSLIKGPSTTGKTPPIKRTARGMSYGRLFIIISRTNASYDGGIFLTGINQILGPHQSLATIVLVFILTVKNIGPANNDQSLCYAGYQRRSLQLAFGTSLRDHRVIVFIFTVNND